MTRAGVQLTRRQRGSCRFAIDAVRRARAVGVLKLARYVVEPLKRVASRHSMEKESLREAEPKRLKRRGSGAEAAPKRRKQRSACIHSPSEVAHVLK